MGGLRSDAARNRARVLDAARGLRVRGEPVQLNAVAHAAEVGVGTVYRHFATVGELQEALVVDRFAEVQDLAERPGPAGVEGFLHGAFAVLAADELFAEVATRPTPALQATADARSSLIGAVAARLHGARAAGELTAAIDAPGVLALLCGVAHAVRSSRAPDDRAASMLQVVLDGLRQPTAGARLPEGRIPASAADGPDPVHPARIP